MSLAVIYSRASLGMQAPLVEVEVHLSPGLPKVIIVGLPETVVKESKDRVRSAIINSNFVFPAKRITINLTPANLPKEGGRYDLAIAIGILCASNQVSCQALTLYEFGGELTLSGELRAFNGVLPMVIAANAAARALILPHSNAQEGAYIKSAKIYAANNLTEVCQHLEAKQLLQHVTAYSSTTTDATINKLDISDIYGQHQAKRALEIAAAGGHSMLMKGPPGSGKTMLAQRLTTILPNLTEQEHLEVASLYSIKQGNNDLTTHTIGQRPFRAPHHSASSAALVGGGRLPKPGEVSLAHHGILFLDELPEFHRTCLEALREPLEAKNVTIARASYSIEYPAHFQLIAAMNPCPCGYWRDNSNRCHCSQDSVARYQNKISGPFLDRIDLFVTLPSIKPQMLMQASLEMPIVNSNLIKDRVIAARARQLARAATLNADLNITMLQQYCDLQQRHREYVMHALERFQMSARSYHRLLRVARTIADLAAEERIGLPHLQEALTLKPINHLA